MIFSKSTRRKTSILKTKKIYSGVWNFKAKISQNCQFWQIIKFRPSQNFSGMYDYLKEDHKNNFPLISNSNPGGKVRISAITLHVQAEVGHTISDFQSGHINLKTDFTDLSLFLRYTRQFLFIVGSHNGGV